MGAPGLLGWENFRAVNDFGAIGDDLRPLREHVRVSWRKDSKAFAITIDDRFYSNSSVFALNKKAQFVEVPLPGDEEISGFPAPNSDDLRPRGRSMVSGWDDDGLLSYSVFLSPGPTYKGKDPLAHKARVEVKAGGMRVVERQVD